jgi:crossover junction endodeoxyribonuclease RusA
MERKTRQEVIVCLPLPPRELSPNARTSRWRRIKRTRQYRHTAGLTALAAAECRLGWTRAVAQATFYWPDGQRRDIRNAEASLKAAYDGIVDAGVILDDRAEVLGHEATVFSVDSVRPRVEIRIMRKNGN